MPASPASLLGNFVLDTCGQNERTNWLYTQITFCFALPDESERSRSQVIQILNDGLSYMTRTFPWTAGQVVRADGGQYQVKPYHDAAQNTLLVVKNLRNEPSAPTWDTLQNQRFPFCLLDEDLVAPCPTLVEPGAPLPALRAQATFIQGGGLLLTVNGHHGSMDMTAQGQVIALLAKARRGEVFRSEEVEGGNARRTGVIPVFEDDSDISQRLWTPEEEARGESSDGGAIAPSDDAAPTAATTKQIPLSWSYLAFSAGALASIKALAAADIPTGIFVSTDDALSAFTWQAISGARAPHLQDIKLNNHHHHHHHTIPQRGSPAPLPPPSDIPRLHSKLNNTHRPGIRASPPSLARLHRHGAPRRAAGHGGTAARSSRTSYRDRTTTAPRRRRRRRRQRRPVSASCGAAHAPKPRSPPELVGERGMLQPGLWRVSGEAGGGAEASLRTWWCTSCRRIGRAGSWWASVCAKMIWSG
ncbi:unnamed protein product [Discula destructiva]